MEFLKKLEYYRKFVVALASANVDAFALVATADFSTLEGVVAFVVAELTAFGVYVVPNKPPVA